MFRSLSTSLIARHPGRDHRDHRASLALSHRAGAGHHVRRLRVHRRRAAGRTGVQQPQRRPGIRHLLLALAGILVCRWLFNIPVLALRQNGAWGDASTAGYSIAAAAALVATSIMHLLLIATPRPQMFFTWIGLVTVIAVVYPVGTTAPLSQKAADRHF